jgi:predicted SAM-dependent methyltransferase
MIDRTLEWIEEVNREFRLKPKRVLDVGSRDTNGNPRYLFPDSEYIGIDFIEGENVDRVIDAHDLSSEFSPNHFDTVLCLHLLEHVARPWLVLEEINWVIKDEGYLYVAMPTVGYPVHEHPGDYWRATEQAMKEVIFNGYEILSLEHAKSTYGKHPVIHCLGVRDEVSIR